MDAGKPDAGRTDAGTDAGYDAGVDAGTDAGTMDAGCTAVMPCTERINACGMKCGCISEYNPVTMAFEMRPYCDPDVGNPCPLGCFNPKEADGGRQYTDWDAGTPVCFC